MSYPSDVGDVALGLVFRERQNKDYPVPSTLRQYYLAKELFNDRLLQESTGGFTFSMAKKAVEDAVELSLRAQPIKKINKVRGYRRT